MDALLPNVLLLRQMVNKDSQMSEPISAAGCNGVHRHSHLFPIEKLTDIDQKTPN